MRLFLLTAFGPAQCRRSQRCHGAISWLKFLGMAKRQRVAGLVHEALSAAGIELPAEVASEIPANAQQIARQNLLLAAETIRLHRIFEAANIPVLVLKGAVLAQLARGVLDAKHTRDIDLLVLPDRAIPSTRLLERGSYVLISPAHSPATAPAAPLSLSLYAFTSVAVVARQVNHAAKVLKGKRSRFDRMEPNHFTAQRCRGFETEKENTVFAVK